MNERISNARLDRAAERAKEVGPDESSPSTGFGKDGIKAEPKYDGNLLPAMTAMVTGFVDKMTKERAKLFRESTTDLLPEFAHMIKKGTL